MKRILSNWVQGYLQYTENTEPAKAFQLWTAYSLIASVLRRKTWLSLGRIKIYPNLYIVFVANPGVARKSQSITFGLEFMTKIPDLFFSADAITREALLDDLEKSAVEDPMPDGTSLRHSSLSIVSKEFESFLGQKKENTKMCVLLTDLFDCPTDAWKYRTKHSGSNSIAAAWLNLHAATTPDSLASSLPATAIGGGLTSRILFVWADKKYKKVSRPIITPDEEKLKEILIKDLYAISRIAGEYVMSPEAEKKWDDWYEAYDEMAAGRNCPDPSFDGWYSRKPTYIIKVAIVIAASKRQNTMVEWKDLTDSIKQIEVVEKSMGNAFRSVGRSMIASEVDIVMQLIKTRGIITEKELMSIVWRDIDSNKLDNVIETCIKTGRIKRTYLGPMGQSGEIWYKHQTQKGTEKGDTENGKKDNLPKV